MNNPQYLKSKDSSGNGKETAIQAFKNVQFAELNLKVPLKVFGQKRSDQYLKMIYSKEKKKKKNQKKFKHILKKFTKLCII